MGSVTVLCIPFFPFFEQTGLLLFSLSGFNITHWIYGGGWGCGAQRIPMSGDNEMTDFKPDFDIIMS